MTKKTIKKHVKTIQKADYEILEGINLRFDMIIKNLIILNDKVKKLEKRK